MAKPKKLTDEQQRFIVQSLACFVAPSRIIEQLKEDDGVEVSHQLIREYNPERNRSIAAKWRTIFEETRKAFLKQTAQIGISHQVYRLRELQWMYDQAGKNFVLKKDILKQAAEEMGGVFTNKRVFDLGAREALAQMLGLKPEEIPVPTKKG